MRLFRSNMQAPLVVLLIALALLIGLGIGWLLRTAVGPSSIEPEEVARTIDITTTPTSAPTATILALPPTPASLPRPPLPTEVIGYNTHIIAPGDDLVSIAIIGGSDASLIKEHNRLNDTLVPGRVLLVPQLAGQISMIAQTPQVIERGRTDQPWVALTFDAGADAAPLPDMLQTLRERDVRVTFFLTGTWVQTYPELAKQIVADGHEVGNHSLTHTDFRDLAKEEITRELTTTEQLIQETTGVSTMPLFRPPYGGYNDDVLRIVIDEGYLPIYWTLDSLDSVGEPKTPEFLVERITATLTPEELYGAIILVHCGSAATATALPTILDRFTQLGLEVRPLSDVLGR